ncbi:hypothetical protein HQ393_05695 [Chitinibacter bivalviorum]|uniref:Uncharacterized protein n=1 Tax=Chitinibacter bivalviorum TaxID=2739434 RepID=A0A7H9BGE6_9NEIS|nr:hypothetical protein [Chitinibacter bivalviorum]QLG87790.1 hypothetical protein HQ393_05695 [Chitinibacter bivalviorum]
MSNLTHASIASTCTLLLLTACGGGGGGSPAPAPTAAPTASPSPTTATSYNSLSEVKVAANMNWQLSATKSIPMAVKYADNSVAAGVVIKLFTYSTSDPHASTAPTDVTSTPTEPVPVSLIDSVMTDANGLATWQVSLPGQQTSVLAIINDGTHTNTQIIQLNQTGQIALTL